MDLDGIEVKWSKSYSVVSDSLQPHGLYSPGQNTGVGSLSLLQGIFPTQGYNPGLPHCRRILYQLSHEGSPRILEWVAYPFSSRSSQPRVSFIAGRFFTNWTIINKGIKTSLNHKWNRLNCSDRDGKGQKEKRWKRRISILIPIPIRLETAKHIPLDSFF